MPNLNKSEWNLLVPMIVMFAAPYLAKLGISNDQASMWLGDLGSLVSASYILYSAWNMKQVRETAIISGHAVDRQTAEKLSMHVEGNTNMPAPAHESPAQFTANPGNRP